MSSYTSRMNLRSLGERTYTSKQIMGSFLSMLVAIGLITAGSLLVEAQSIIKELNPDKASDLNNTFGSILIVAGSVLVLYGLFKFFTKSA